MIEETLGISLTACVGRRSRTDSTFWPTSDSYEVRAAPLGRSLSAEISAGAPALAKGEDGREASESQSSENTRCQQA